MSGEKKRGSAIHTLKKLGRKLSPAQTIALSFLFIILVGGLLLTLPFSQERPGEVPVLDAFFTAVSAVCVTGLVTLPTATTWSFFGKAVILLLIQIGGLSLITLLAYFMVNTGRKISLKSRLALQAAFNSSSLGGMVRMVLFVIKITLICELTGAALLFIAFLHQGIVWYRALLYGIFHAVSAFCNAGFDVLGTNSLIPYANNLGLNLVIMALIVAGGMGFTVWRELVERVRFCLSRRIKKKSRLSVHARLALFLTAALLLLGMVFFLAVEYDNPQTLGPLPLPQKLLAALFQSVTLRTAGFATIAQEGLTEASKLFSSLLMLIGGSPGGTAGGIKTVTLAIIFCGVWSALKGRRKIVLFGRAVSEGTLQKALTMIVLMLTLLFIGTALLGITEGGTAYPHGVADLIFEVASALGTVGLTTGITPYLTGLGKLLLMLCMFIGRIGPVTLMISLLQGGSAHEDVVGYPSEDVMIG